MDDGAAFIEDKAKRGITFSKRKAGIFSKVLLFIPSKLREMLHIVLTLNHLY